MLCCGVVLLGVLLWYSGVLSLHPAILAAFAVALYLWRDAPHCVIDPCGLLRVILIVKLFLTVVATAAFLVAASEMRSPWAYAMTLVVSGLVYRFTCGRFGTLATMEAIERWQERRAP